MEYESKREKETEKKRERTLVLVLVHSGGGMVATTNNNNNNTDDCSGNADDESIMYIATVQRYKQVPLVCVCVYAVRCSTLIVLFPNDGKCDKSPKVNVCNAVDYLQLLSS